MYCDQCIIYWFYWVKRDNPPLWPLYLSHFTADFNAESWTDRFFFNVRSLIVTTPRRSGDWLMVVGSGYPHSSTSRVERQRPGTCCWVKVWRLELWPSTTYRAAPVQVPAETSSRLCWLDTVIRSVFVTIQSPLIGLHHLKKVSISYIYL